MASQSTNVRAAFNRYKCISKDDPVPDGWLAVPSHHVQVIRPMPVQEGDVFHDWHNVYTVKNVSPVIIDGVAHPICVAKVVSRRGRPTKTVAIHEHSLVDTTTQGTPSD